MGDTVQCPELDPKLHSVILERCLAYLGLPNTYSLIGGRTCGSAYLSGGKVYKITTDKSEAIESAKIVGKNNQHLVNVFNVKRVNNTLTDVEVYLIVMEHLRTDREPIFAEIEEALTSIFQKEMNIHFMDLIYYYRFDPEKYKTEYEERINQILSVHQREKYFYDSLLKIADELKANGIDSLDLQSHNLGLKPNGNLGFFDLGYGDEHGKVNAINVNERVMSYMKNSSAVGIARKCKFGGNKDGTSNACNKGDISNITLKPISEHTSRHNKIYNKKMVAEEVKVDLNDLPFKQDVEQAGGKLYSVGGAVRDKLLGKQSKDLDILITGIPLDKLEQILSKYGRIDSVGKSFGIIKFNTPETGEIDIAIPRTERKNDQGGYQGFDVTSDHELPIEKDLERRDFTINAIAKDSSGLMIDPYGGQDDIEKKQIKMVNPQAFSDDPLRMLRAVQFASRFGFEIEPTTLQAIQQNAAKIKEISPERILIEFDKIVNKGNQMVGAKLLRQTGLYSQIFGVNRGINLADFNKSKTMGEFVFGLTRAAVDNPAEFYKTNLKGDLDTYNELRALQIGKDFKGDRKTIFDMYKTYPKSVETDIFGQKFTDAIEYMRTHNIPFSLKDVPVNGNDLMQLGFQGKQIGETFVDVLNKIYREELPNEREAILNYVKSGSVNENIFSLQKDDYLRLTDDDLKREIQKILNFSERNVEGKAQYFSNEELHDLYYSYLAVEYNRQRVLPQLSPDDSAKYSTNKAMIIQKLRDIGLIK